MSKSSKRIHVVVNPASGQDQYILNTINDAFHHWRAKEITIETEQPQPIQGDGEIWGTTPISIQVLPNAMRVLVPGE